MTSREPGGTRFTPAQLDALLEGRTSGAQPLDRLISAARAPGRPDELAGLDAALDAVAAASVTPLSRSRWLLTRVGAVTAATKIVALSAVGAAAVGGVVVAGATGHLPGQHRHRPAGVTASAGPGPGSSVAGSPVASPSGPTTPSRGPSTTAPSGPTSTGQTPGVSASASIPVSVSLPDLCRQWLALPAGPGPQKGRPEFSVLIRVAGGKSSVSGYCRRLPTTPTATPATSSPIPPSRGIVTPTPSSSRSHRPTGPSSRASSTERGN